MDIQLFKQEFIKPQYKKQSQGQPSVLFSPILNCGYVIFGTTWSTPSEANTCRLTVTEICTSWSFCDHFEICRLWKSCREVSTQQLFIAGVYFSLSIIYEQLSIPYLQFMLSASRSNVLDAKIQFVRPSHFYYLKSYSCFKLPAIRNMRITYAAKSVFFCIEQ